MALERERENVPIVIIIREHFITVEKVAGMLQSKNPGKFFFLLCVGKSKKDKPNKE